MTTAIKKVKRKANAQTNRIQVNREIQIAPDSLNEANRTVRAVLSTPIAVRVYDWAEDRYIDEVLLPWGCRPAEHVKFIERHNNDLRAVLGSILNITADENEVAGDLQFSASPDVDPIFIRVKEKHLRAVSIGGDYTLDNTVELAPGRSRTFRGLTLTATDVPMRVVRIWELLHTGLVQDGADENAKIRERRDKNATRFRGSYNSKASKPAPRSTSNLSNRTTSMRFSSRAMKYLVSVGMKSDSNHEAAVAYARGLSPTRMQTLFNRDRRAAQILERAASEVDHVDSDEETDDDREELVGAGSRQRSSREASSRDDSSRSNLRSKSSARDKHRILPQRSRIDRRDNPSEDVLAERERVRSIRELATPEIPEKMVQRAIDGGDSVDEARSDFYRHLTQMSRQHTPRRDPSQASGVAPAGHVARGLTLRGLQAGLLNRYECDWDNGMFKKRSMRAMLNREARWMHRANEARENDQQMDDESAHAIDTAHRVADMSLFDVCRQVVKLSGRRVPSTREGVLRAAFSTADLPKAFGPAINYKILEGYETYADSTVGWVSRSDWNDFRTNDMLTVDPASRLKPHVRNTTAQSIELSERGSSYSISRFVGMFQLDDMDIINDRLGITDDLANKLGEMAREIPIDLVYAWLLSNPNAADGNPTFHSSHGNNQTSAPFNADNIELVEALFGNQTVTMADGSVKALNLKAGFVLVPRSLRLKAKKILASITRTDAAGNTNPLNDEFRYASDARLDQGVKHPLTGAVIAGAPTTWYMFEEKGRYFLDLGFRRGTGRAPTTRSRPLNEPGRWGYAWDVNMDCGIGLNDTKGGARALA